MKNIAEIAIDPDLSNETGKGFMARGRPEVSSLTNSVRRLHRLRREDSRRGSLTDSLVAAVKMRQSSIRRARFRLNINVFPAVAADMKPFDATPVFTDTLKTGSQPSPSFHPCMGTIARPAYRRCQFSDFSGGSDRAPCPASTQTAKDAFGRAFSRLSICSESSHLTWNQVQGSAICPVFRLSP